MKRLLLSIALISALSSIALAREKVPKFAFGLNAGQPLVLGIASSLFQNSLLLPFSLDVHASFSKKWGLAGNLLYRYHKDGSALSLNEIAVIAGPRWNFSGRNITGGYLTLKVGVGIAVGKDYWRNNYHRFDFIIHPEIGYAISWGAPSVYLAFGIGMQTMIPLFQNPGSINWNSLGKLITYYLPYINVTVGFSI